MKINLGALRCHRGWFSERLDGPIGSPCSGRDQQHQRVNFYDAYRPRTPEAIIGNSIYVFRVR